MKPKPFAYANLYLTRRCNMACSYCNLVVGNDAEELSTEEWKEIIYETHQIAEYLDLFGGELTLREDLPELVSYCAELGIRFGAETNGSQSIDYYVELLDRGLPFLCFSCDGLEPRYCSDKYSYAKSRRAAAIVPAIQHIMTQGILDIGVVIAPQNVDHILELGRRFADSGVPLCYQVLQTGKHRRLSKSELPIGWNSEFKAKLRNLTSALALKGEALGVCLIDPPQLFAALHEHGTLDTRWHCSVPVLTVDYDGSVASCYDRLPVDLCNMTWKDVVKDPEAGARHALMDQLRCEGCFWINYWMVENSYLGNLPWGVGGFI